MAGMFMGMEEFEDILRYKNSLLMSLDISSFDTSKVEDMQMMFSGLRLLTSLNLSNFDISKVSKVEMMFYGCELLEYINLNNFHKNILLSRYNSDYSDIFFNISQNAVICYNNITENDLIFSQIKENINCYSIDCTENWKSSQKKIILYNDTCIDDCKNDLIFNYEYNGICYDDCSNGIINNTINICKCELKECLECPPQALKNNLCSKCNYEYYPIEGDPNNIGGYIKCYKDPKGYFLEENIYKKCYHTCDLCAKKGNYTFHNCLKCNFNYTFEIMINNYTNCYVNCSYYYYFDSNNNYICTINNSCPEEYNKLIRDKNQCINNCENDDIYKYEFNNICYNYDINISSTEFISTNLDSEITYNNFSTTNINSIMIFSTINEENENINEIMHESFIKNCTVDENGENICLLNYDINITNESYIYYIQDIILENLENELIQGKYNLSIINNGKENIIKTELMTITVTNTNNQKNMTKSNKNVTIIDLDQCESILKNYYNISTIYIKKIDVVQKGMKIPKILYDFYANLNISNYNLIQLNKSLCDNSDIILYFPIKISKSENIDEFNSSSGYYNDICYGTTSDEGTDILLEDRTKEYFEKNKTVCQEDCYFDEYDYTLNKAKCKCKIEESILSFSDMNINKNKLYENFKNVKNIANIDILICFNELLTKEGLIKNFGFYISNVNIIFGIITVLIFYMKQFVKIKNIINDITYSLK